MTAIIIRGHMLAELADSLGIDPGEATMSRIMAAITPRAAAAFAGKLKSRQIRDRALELAARDTARSQPEHAADWEAIAAALRDHTDGTDPQVIARALRSHLDGIDAEAAAETLRDGLR